MPYYIRDPKRDPAVPAGDVWGLRGLGFRFKLQYQPGMKQKAKRLLKGYKRKLRQREFSLLNKHSLDPGGSTQKAVHATPTTDDRTLSHVQRKYNMLQEQWLRILADDRSEPH